MRSSGTQLKWCEFVWLEQCTIDTPDWAETRGRYWAQLGSPLACFWRMAHVAVWSSSRTRFPLAWREMRVSSSERWERQQPLISKLVGIGKINTTSANLGVASRIASCRANAHHGLREWQPCYQNCPRIFGTYCCHFFFCRCYSCCVTLTIWR